MASITLENVSKTFPGGPAAVRDLSLEIRDGEFMVLVGPSGSGKSTALRLIAGLETASSGRIRIGGQDVTDLGPRERDLAMVFQSYALYPHKTVRENLAFGLRMRGVDRAATEKRVREVARMLQIDTLLDRRPAQLSGGQRQRVALGRAMVRTPRAFLFDEPLSNLDPALRGDTRAELLVLHRRLGATMIYVTHDQEEAMTLGDRIAILHEGTLRQVAAPREVYERPNSVFVARFIGSPPMNLLRARADAGTARVLFNGAGVQLPAPPGHLPADVLLGIRPHDIAIAVGREIDLQVQVDLVETLGRELHVRARPDGAAEAQAIVFTASADAQVAPGDRIGLHFRRDRLHLFDARTSQRLE